jgi:hypothetical protein
LLLLLSCHILLLPSFLTPPLLLNACVFSHALLHFVHLSLLCNRSGFHPPLSRYHFASCSSPLCFLPLAFSTFVCMTLCVNSPTHCSLLSILIPDYSSVHFAQFLTSFWSHSLSRLLAHLLLVHPPFSSSTPIPLSSNSLILLFLFLSSFCFPPPFLRSEPNSCVSTMQSPPSALLVVSCSVCCHWTWDLYHRSWSHLHPAIFCRI